MAAGLLAISFGVLARPVMGPVAPIVMSAIVFAGSSQFAAAGIAVAGGAAALRAPILVVIASAAAVTALARTLA